jgi:hypothetical protein
MDKSFKHNQFAKYKDHKNRHHRIIFSDPIIENLKRGIAKYCIFIKICAQDLQPLEEFAREGGIL